MIEHILKDIRLDCELARTKGGMTVGLPSIKLDCSHADRICLEFDRLRADLDTAERALDAQTDFRAQIALLRADVAELLDALEDVIYQSCYDDERGDGHLDSMALSAYAKGMRVLSKHGRFEIEAEGGRRVIGKLKQEGGE